MKEFNILGILRNKPNGTKLYSPIFGEVTLDKVTGDELIIVKAHNYYTKPTFYRNGKYHKDGECMLFPSKEMYDWSKFAWKKGDVLVSNDGKKEVIFDSFATGDYACFKGKHYLDCSEENNHKYKGEISLFTSIYEIEAKDAAQCYINTIEERLGGKLNMKTLEIEKKPKWTPKPFDKVLVRDANDEKWSANFFSYIADGVYMTINNCDWKQCIPYNEETAKLIGTAESYKEG